MSDKETEDQKDPIVDFSKYAEEKEIERLLKENIEFSEEDFPEKTPEQYLAEGVAAFGESVQDCSAFLAVTIDAEGTPQLIWAGDINPFTAIGALEISKTVFQSRIY